MCTQTLDAECHVRNHCHTGRRVSIDKHDGGPNQDTSGSTETQVVRLRHKFKCWSNCRPETRFGSMTALEEKTDQNQSSLLAVICRKMHRKTVWSFRLDWQKMRAERLLCDKRPTKCDCCVKCVGLKSFAASAWSNVMIFWTLGLWHFAICELWRKLFLFWKLLLSFL